MREIWFRRGDIDLEVVEHGAGSPAMLVLPEFGTGVVAYRRLIEGLGEHYRVLGLSPRGLGRSGWEGPYSLADWIDDAVAVIDRHARRARLGGELLPLSAKEFALLVALAKDPNRVVSKAELLRDVWGFAGPVSRTRTVDSHASRLRRKLAAAGAGERYVSNVWGVGYRLLPDDA